MPASLQLIMALPKVRHLTRQEAARSLGITLAELDEANAFAKVAFPDPDPEFPPITPTREEREAARDRMPKRIAEAQRKAEWEARKR